MIKYLTLLIIFITFSSYSYSQNNYKKFYSNTYVPKEEFEILEKNFSFEGYLVLQIHKKDIKENEIISDVYLIEDLKNIYSEKDKIFLNNCWLYYNLLYNKLETGEMKDSSIIPVHTFVNEYYKTTTGNQNLLIKDNLDCSFLEEDLQNFYKYKKRNSSGFYIYKVKVPIAVISFRADFSTYKKNYKNKKIKNFLPLKNFSLLEPIILKNKNGDNFQLSKWKPQIFN